MWGNGLRFFIFFLFLLVFSVNVFAGDTDVYFAIPGSSASLFPVVDNVDFVSTGVYGFNLSLYLVSSNPDSVNLTNGALVNGSLSRPDGGYSVVNFTNSGSNGFFNSSYDFNVSGSYVLNVSAFNSSLTSGFSSSYVYVGDYLLNYSLSCNDSFVVGDSVLLSLFVNDSVGIPQIGGVVRYRLFLDGVLVINWSNMTDLLDGEYLSSFIVSVPGSYLVESDFFLANNSFVVNRSFIVSSVVTGGGGGGGSIPGGNVSGWSVRYDKPRLVFNHEYVSYRVMFYYNDVLSAPPSLSASLDLPSGLRSIPLSRVSDGSYIFEYDFTSSDVSSSNLVLLWFGGSKVSMLNFVDLPPLFFVDNSIVYPMVVDDNGVINRFALWVLFIVSCLSIILLIVFVWRFVKKRLGNHEVSSR